VLLLLRPHLKDYKHVTKFIYLVSSMLDVSAQASGGGGGWGHSKFFLRCLYPAMLRLVHTDRSIRGDYCLIIRAMTISETMVNFYPTTWCKSQDDNLYMHGGKNIKSRLIYFFTQNKTLYKWRNTSINNFYFSYKEALYQLTPWPLWHPVDR
jgi:hypothetical protein